MKEIDFTLPRQKNLIPEGNRSRYIYLVLVEEALRQSWGPDICADWEKSRWTADNPAFGQCVATALVVQKLFGGKIVKDSDNDHYWNVLKDGTEVDLSREMFNLSVVLVAKEDRTRDYMLKSERAIRAKTRERYNILFGRVADHLKFATGY